MFWNKKRQQFNKIYKKLPARYQFQIIMYLNIFDFLINTIDNNIVNKLRPYINITDDIKRTIYHVVIETIDYSELIKNGIMTQDEEILFAVPLKVWLLCSNKNDIKAAHEFNDFNIDKNLSISFTQMMSKIFSLDNKEYKESEKFKEIYNEYVAICNAFIGGTLTGLKRQKPELLNTKMNQLVDKANDAQLLGLETGFVMILNALGIQP